TARGAGSRGAPRLGQCVVQARPGGAAREALAQGLRNALEYNLVEVADEIRADMLKSAGAEHLEELAETIDVIGGGTALERRFIRLGLLGKGGVGEVSRASTWPTAGTWRSSGSISGACRRQIARPR
ncbi:hypothetical protein, partial [Methyloceanibacter marginalis]|uniref:hypothetical protein n=1 Tax=Methyloceanibacter marginalis TaxID=1774971 RepID=UPI00195C47C3